MTKIKTLAIDHSYYCSTTNYFNNDCTFEYVDWAEFFSDMGDADEDFNFLFRWDIIEDRDDEDEPTGRYYMNLHFMQQRKGKYVCCIIKSVKDEDTEEIQQYLRYKFAYISALWAPVSY